MSIAPFSTQAASACPAPLLLAAAAEFRPVDGRGVRAALERLATRLHADIGKSASASEQGEAIVRLLVEEGLRRSTRVTPEDTMIDSVIAAREGHPVLLAAICVEVGRRAGLSVAPIGTSDIVLVGVRDPEGPVVVDVWGEHGGVPSGIAWQCSHEVAFAALTHLARLQAMHGRLVDAIRAAELRGVLPLAAGLRRRVRFEARALRAQLS